MQSSHQSITALPLHPEQRAALECPTCRALLLLRPRGSSHTTDTRQAYAPICRERDHLTPEACNTDKGQLTLEEYRIVVAFRKGWLKQASLRFPGEDK